MSDVIRYNGDEFPNVPKVIESLKRRNRNNKDLVRLENIKKCEKCNTETEPSKLFIVNGEWEYWKAVCERCFLGGLLPE